MSVVDRVVEGWSRRLAARSTRRSFLGRVGRTTVLVAAGPTLATMLAGRAEARVCGQSGVSPLCPTYDCVGPGTTWGWCWYASGDVCCAGGGLKKICDCCKANHPNVHGYCPAGTNVYCIVESCWADPRVMAAPVVRFGGGDAAFTAAAVSRSRFPAGSTLTVTPVLADADDAVAIAVAAPLAAVTGAPLLLTRRVDVPAATIAELQRLGARGARVVGVAVTTSVDAQLARYGITAERVAAVGGADASSAQVARLVIAATGRRAAVVLAVEPATVAAAPSIGAIAATAALPVVVGVAAAATLAAEGLVDRCYVVGASAAADVAGIPAPTLLDADPPARLARLVAGAVADREALSGFDAWLAPVDAPLVLAGLTGCGGAVLARDPRRLDAETERWILDRVGRVARGVWVADVPDDHSTSRLQAALNHFDAHRLAGVPGQGLPVISQPFPERDLGHARIAGAPPADAVTSAGQWVSRINPTREP